MRNMSHDGLAAHCLFQEWGHDYITLIYSFILYMYPHVHVLVIHCKMCILLPNHSLTSSLRARNPYEMIQGRESSDPIKT